MRATAKRARGVNDTFAARIKHGAGSGDVRGGQAGAPCGTESGGGEHGFAFGEDGSLASELELTALGAADAVTLDGAGSELGVDSPDLLQCFGFNLAG